ncbi:ATP-binding protein [Neobacillus muris]|uniref:ATP-binding protein n=1 Tax=Neobacillus muris TaxID=2941334 RepID=UPI00203EA29E|nr:ATP-binding protein [Neobacillus muris]
MGAVFRSHKPWEPSLWHPVAPDFKVSKPISCCYDKDRLFEGELNLIAMINSFFTSWYPAYFLLTSVALAILVIVFLPYRNNHIAKYFIILLALDSFQAFLSVLEITSGQMDAMIWYRNLQQIPLLGGPVVLFFCILESIGKQKIIEKYGFYFFLPTVIDWLLIFTDQYHHLMRTSINILSFSDISKLSITSTHLSQFFIGYVHILMVFAMVLLCVNMKKAAKYVRVQNLFLLLVIVLSLGYDVIIDILNIHILNFRAITYFPIGIWILMVVKRHKIFSIYPIAKDLIIENMKDGMLVVDNELKIADYNQAAKQIGRVFLDVEINEDRMVSNRLKELIETYEKTNQNSFEYSFMMENQLKAFQFTINPIKNKKGTQLGYLIIAQDVSVHKQLHHELERGQRERLEFLSSISHDIRNPLTSIIGFSRAIMDGKIDRSDKRYIHYIYDRSILIEKLVNDLLELTRLESGSIQFKYVSVDVKKFFEKLFQDFHQEISSAGKYYTYEIKVDQLFMDMDMLRMEQVFHNLIGNAMKHTDSGDSIRILVYVKESWLMVEVSDTGTGIPEEVLGYVFERYYTSHSTSSSHGLGLAICKQIIEMHHGEIGVNSEVGKGSTFSLTLPLRNQGGNTRDKNIDGRR